jgi:hypothetical protein
MKTIYLQGKEIKLYDSIDEMPIRNFQKYNKYVLIDSGVGSDLDSVDKHIVDLAKIIKSGDKARAMQELQNMRQNMHLIVEKISPKYLAFAALIHSIDGKEQTDLSDTGLKEILSQLSKVQHSFVVDLLIWLKKKLSSELEAYFPAEFDSSKEREVYDKLKQRTLLVLQGIAEDKDTAEKVNAIDEFLFNLYKPQTFIGKESVEIRYDKQFESACLIISQKTNMDGRKMTVLQFYSALDNISKQIESEKKAYSRQRK